MSRNQSITDPPNQQCWTKIKTLGVLGTLAVTPLVMTGCNDAQAGLLLGGGIGALTGQAIGHDTCSTLLGLGIGAGAGYVIGNESDKARADQYGYHEWHSTHYRHYDRYHGNYDY